MDTPLPTQVDQTKRSLRAAIIPQLRGFDPQARESASRQILAQLLELPECAHARTVMGFLATQEEPWLDPLITLLPARGIRFAAPRNDWHAREITPCLLSSPSDAIATRHNLREPGPLCTPVEPSEIDLILVPGVAFDAFGKRLGRGGGFYDRFLGRPDMRARRVGIAFDLQVVPDVPALVHDARMDLILTQSRLIRPAPASR
ncbi:MAG TPA: 5-formyltetrahydrofolate cyclo-ligase [Phycisphaerales bacterium]|nr:5-formyltetrahydrofolate cyclo-ligase [Phycisphaerales bacterium]